MILVSPFLIFKKSFFIFSLSLIILLPITALSQNGSSQIAGKIIDLNTGLPLADVNVVLYSGKDSLLLKGSLTDVNGLFKIPNLFSGKYYIESSFIGYKKERTSTIIIDHKAAITNIGTIKMIPDILELDEIELVATKKAFKNSIDRKVYNVGQDIMAQSNNATEILNNIPTISVNIDGQVSLRGTSNITFFINGRPSSLMRINRTMALQQIPASTIERIEVITNPSAKYKPDGVGGIINIVLKKDKKLGFNGALIVNARNSKHYNTTLSMNYNTGKINIYGNYGFRNSTSQKRTEDSRILKDSLGQIEEFYQNDAKAYSKDRSHVFNAGLDYAINDKNHFSISTNFYKGREKEDSYESTRLNNSEGLLFSEYNSANTEQEDQIEFEISSSYEHAFDEDKILSLNVDYSNYDEKEDFLFLDDFIFPENQSLYTHNAVKKYGPNFDFDIEYSTPIKEGEIEVGYYYELFKDNIDFYTEARILAENNWEANTDKANLFIFTQQIHALYGTYGNSIGKLHYLAGLRTEQALVSSNLTTLDSIVDNNYFKIYPTLHLSYVLNESQQIQINYSHRVNRADSDEHNPFPDYKDSRTIETGNPKLKPEQIHSVELGYELKKDNYSFIPSLYYRYKFNGFSRVNSIINDSILLQNYVNLSKQEALGVEMVLSSSFGNSVDVNLNFNGYYNVIDASNLGLSESRSAFSWSTKLLTQIRLATDTNFQLNTNYRSSRITTQGSRKPSFVFSCGIRQGFFDRKISATLTISDVFNTLRREREINTRTLEQKTTYKRQSQIIYLGFKYNFGQHVNKTPDKIKFDDQI